jgi:hypothetical protein
MSLIDLKLGDLYDSRIDFYDLSFTLDNRKSLGSWYELHSMLYPFCTYAHAIMASRCEGASAEYVS